MEIEVTLMSGAGNIFSVVDNTRYNLSEDFFQNFAKVICEGNYQFRRTEGLLVIEKDNTDTVDFKLKYYNPDGSFGMMCGNGGRCAVFYAVEKKIITKAKETILFDVWDVNYSAFFENNLIKIKFPPPQSVHQNKSLSVDGELIIGDYVNVNSPHFVVEFDQLKLSLEYDFFNFPLEKFAPKIRFHQDFQPEGVNVNVFISEHNKVYIRTFERGVERETGACGTGAISTSISLFLKNKKQSKYTIVPPSKEDLEVAISHDIENIIKEVYLIGNAKILDVQRIQIDT